MLTIKLEYQDIKLKLERRKKKMISHYSVRTFTMAEGKGYEEISHRDIIRGGSEVL